MCTCENGASAYGADCPTHDQQFCMNCNLGSTLVNNVCVVNTCTCDNGVLTTGTSCPTHNQEFCSSCNEGNIKVNNICVANICDVAGSCDEASGELKVCTCANGAAAYGDSCPTHNQQFCTGCNTGSSMINNVCVPGGFAEISDLGAKNLSFRVKTLIFGENPSF